MTKTGPRDVLQKDKQMKTDIQTVKLTYQKHIMHQIIWYGDIQSPYTCIYPAKETSLTCLTPWYIHSQKRSNAERKEAWNIPSNIPGTQLFTKNVRGNIGSVKEMKHCESESY